jgi:hypothetical protein
MWREELMLDLGGLGMAAGAIRANQRVAAEFGLDADEARDGAQMWDRVRRRLRAELGEDVFSSWFARVDLEGVTADVVRLSVPTLFLKGWITSHYGERLPWHLLAQSTNRSGYPTWAADGAARNGRRG